MDSVVETLQAEERLENIAEEQKERDMRNDIWLCLELNGLNEVIDSIEALALKVNQYGYHLSIDDTIDLIKRST